MKYTDLYRGIYISLFTFLLVGCKKKPVELTPVVAHTNGISGVRIWHRSYTEIANLSDPAHSYPINFWPGDTLFSIPVIGSDSVNFLGNHLGYNGTDHIDSIIYFGNTVYDFTSINVQPSTPNGIGVAYYFTKNRVSFIKVVNNDTSLTILHYDTD